MAITCEWEKPLGTCFWKYDEGKKYPLTIYGGGNCLAVICTEEKNLVGFFIDESHLKRHELEGTEYKDMVIFGDRKKSALKLLKLFANAGFDVTYKAKKE